MPGSKSSKLFHNAEETSKPEIGTITGIIPDYVKGDFIRVGPGLWDLPEAKLNHFVDGYAMLLKFHMDGKSVSLEKKFLESDAYKRAIAAKKPLVNEFGTRAFSDSSKSFLSRVVATLIPEVSDNNYCTPFTFNNELFVGAESGAIRSVNQQSLRSTERYDAKKCFGCESFSAHPLKDENGDLYHIAISLTMTALKNNIIRIPHGTSGTTKDLIKKGKVVCSLPNRRNGAVSSQHSFGMTSNYIICVECPYYLILSKLLSSLVKGTTISEWLEWYPEDKNAFYVYEKSTGKLLKRNFVSEQAFYYMHFINCFEEDDQIVVDINCYDSPSVMDTLNIKNLREGNAELKDHPYAVRYVIPLVDPNQVEEDVNLVNLKCNSKAVKRADTIVLSPDIITEIHGAELPCINQTRFGQKYEYYYMAGTYNPSKFSHSIVKVNVDTKDLNVWKDNDFLYPSEPVFIPNPNGDGSEDDGILMSAVVDSRENQQDFLLYLDAKKMEEIGRVHFTNRIPSGLHGIFISAE